MPVFLAVKVTIQRRKPDDEMLGEREKNGTMEAIGRAPEIVLHRSSGWALLDLRHHGKQLQIDLCGKFAKPADFINDRMGSMGANHNESQ